MNAVATGPVGVRRDVAELLGTAMRVLVGPGAAMVAARTHAFGLVVTLVVASSGHLGGARIDPSRSPSPSRRGTPRSWVSPSRPNPPGS